jgi:hypothetical protein
MASKSAVTAKGAANYGAFPPSFTLVHFPPEVRLVIGDYSYDVTAFKGEAALFVLC